MKSAGQLADEGALGALEPDDAVDAAAEVEVDSVLLEVFDESPPEPVDDPPVAAVSAAVVEVDSVFDAPAFDPPRLSVL